MSKSKDTNGEKSLKLYNDLIARSGKVERKGKTTPYTSLNGHMFSFLSKDGTVGLRLSDADRKDFMQKFNSGLMEQYGRIMKEYVRVPLYLLENTELLSEYFKLSYDYVSALKPKPTKT